MKQYDYLIVGSGLSGATAAFLLHSQGEKVLLIEKRPSLGGNIATSLHDGIIVHDYGPHIFHTSNEDVWRFVNEHCEMYDFINSPLANFNGRLYHMPFNMNTFHELWGVTKPEEAKAIIEAEIKKENVDEPHNLEEQALKLVGRTIYETLIKGYTEKQWGRSCKELPASIIKRVPLRFEYNNNYFNDKYQGLPKGGYSVLINNLLNDIETRTNQDFLEKRDYYASIAKTIIYTGPLDAFFNYSEGKLEYRSLRFEVEEIKTPDFQSNPVVNYTSSKEPFTRITEHKHFDPFCANHETTIITKEYPALFSGGNEPMYTINDDANTTMAKAYLSLAKKLEPKVYFLGRLANYQYLDMDDAIENAINLVSSF